MANLIDQILSARRRWTSAKKDLMQPNDFSSPSGCLTPWDKQTIRVYGPTGSFCSVAANTGGGQNRQSVLAFAQNTRDEVRILGTDGQICGALAASPGMKQTTYVAENRLNSTKYTEENEMNEKEETVTAQSSPSSNGTGPKRIRPPSKYLKPEFQEVTSEVRRITPTEAQRLQGFDEGHLESGGMTGDASRFSAVGNSWAVNCARRVIKGIHKADEVATGRKSAFKYGTISSGVEAHTQASHDLGDRAVFYSEIAPAPSAFLAKKYPETPNLGDMTLVDYDAEKKVIHNRPYDGYTPVGKDVLGFEPYKTDDVVEIPAEYGDVDLVSGGTPCFCAGTMVLTEQGYRPIETIREGDMVMTHMGRLRPVTAIGAKMATNIVDVKCATAPTIRCTDDHKFWTPVNPHRDFRRKSDTYLRWLFDDMEFRPIRDIGKDGFVARLNGYETIATPPIPKIYNADDLDVIELAGWYVGDGHCAGFSENKHKKVLVLSMSEKKVEEFRRRFNGVVNFSDQIHDKNGVHRVQVANAELCDWLVGNFGHLSHGKRIPAWLIASCDEIRNAFMTGYMATDGFCDKSHSFCCSTTSKALALGLSDMVGKCTIFYSKVPPVKVMYDGRVVHQRNFWSVRRSVNPKMSHEFGKWCNVRVRKITKREPEMVYNITVDGDHGYIVNGICVSNCQSISVAGKRHGAAEGSGTRSSLAFQLPRIGKSVGARWIMWENVAGVFSSNGGSDFLWLLYRCQEAGYTLAWRTFDAQYTFCDKFPRAVPQRRRRVFMVGYKGDDWRIPVRALFEPLKALGSNSPDRKVGKGCVKLNPNFDEETAEVYTTGRNGHLKEKKPKDSPSFDLFSMMGVDEDSPKALHDRDLELAFPDGSDLSEVPLADFYRFCRTIGVVDNGKGFCGNLFSDRERVYRTARYTEIDGKKWTVGGDGSATDVEYAPPDGAKVSTKDLGDGVFEDTWQDGTVPFTTPCVEALEERAMSSIGNAGILSQGRICTMTTPEWTAGLTEEELAEIDSSLRELYDGTVCGLSDILEDDPDPKYLLSWRACWGIVCRATTRKKELPPPLLEALLWQIAWEPEKIKWWAENAPNEEEREKGRSCWEGVVKENREKYICDLSEIVAEPPKKRGADEEEEPDDIDESDITGSEVVDDDEE
ncbi:MAG: DNA cytosine methyltransferase [Bacteroidales bacterium]|nr:DNA cytosine methyltransferase [Bacteroidales bacterium]